LLQIGHGLLHIAFGNIVCNFIQVGKYIVEFGVVIFQILSDRIHITEDVANSLSFVGYE
jgi:hypothetical protein